MIKKKMENWSFDAKFDSLKYNDIRTKVEKFKEKNIINENLESYSQLSDMLCNDSRKNVKTLGLSIRKQIDGYIKERSRVKKLYDFDKSYGYKIVAGVDEVGRGPLAGPIVSASVILDSDDEFILYINDSKKLSKHLREELSEKIKAKAIAYNIEEIANKEIDEKGIGFCNHEVFRRAVNGLKIKPEIVLSDGYLIKDFNIENKAVIKGDTKSASIACASILAKVYRDKIMENYAKEYSYYGFENNVGYGTKEHLAGIIDHGICSIHRKTFLTNILNK